MTPFLQKLARHLLETYKGNISGICVIFPSRRAGSYFRKYLSELIQKPLWSPTVFSIEEFIEDRSSYILADDLVLIFELYNVFKKYGEQETFDEFYPWGEMLIRDFDEIDKYLVPVKNIFRVIKEFKDIEKEFSLPVEDLEQFRAFWRTFSNRELTKVENEFLKIWDLLDQIYSDFKHNLNKKNLAYEGMAIRKLCEEIDSGKIFFNDWQKIIFAGFNSLSKSEHKIIDTLLKNGKGEIYWDTDDFYVNDSLQEAGKFIRENINSLAQDKPLWIENNLNDSEKKSIKIIGSALNIGQAKALGDQLNDFAGSDKFKDDNTAVILPDESLLLPVLYSMPSSIKKMNVTMGFPFRNTPLYNLIELFMNLQLNKKIDGKLLFYHKDVTEILMHPYIKFSAPDYIFDLANEIKRYSIIYLTREKIIENDITSPELLSLIFKPVSSANEIFGYLFKILDVISAKVENSEESYAKFEMEYYFALYEQINRLKDIILLYDETVGEKVFWHILIESLKSIKIPFTGEPLEGVQVMGLLESRSLDFENVFLLSMNEGVMPKGNSHNSFIPYNLRKAFKLPTYEERDSITAYYFYRILQRAKNVFLFYNTETNIVYSGEKSRFLLQIESELSKNPNIEFSNVILQTGTDTLRKNEITIPKHSSLIDRLKKEDHYSASDLKNYISCPLKFYFKKIARIKEEESVEEYFSPAIFGRIFHTIMQIIYSDYIGKTIHKDTIDTLKSLLKSDYNRIFTKAIQEIDELKEFTANPIGKNLLLKNVIKKLVERVLENELKEVPFKLIGLEVKLSKELDFSMNGNNYKIKLFGRIDRIDEKDSIKRILDYKTGNYQKEGKSLSEEQLMEACFEDPQLKEVFQAGLYGYLYLSGTPDNNITLGIYPVKKLDKGIAFIENLDLQGENLTRFENNLKKLFYDIFDENKHFIQTPDKEQCLYCPYIGICYREK